MERFCRDFPYLEYMIERHPLIMCICTVFSFTSLCMGTAMMSTACFGFKWARTGAAACGCMILVPMLAGAGLVYGKHWRFEAFAPAPAISPDGKGYWTAAN